TLPPFTFRISPVMCPARSEQRNTMGPAQSSGLATRPSGIVRSMSSLPRPASLAYGVADISVSTHPGATQFTLIRRGASSTGEGFVRLRPPAPIADGDTGARLRQQQRRRAPNSPPPTCNEGTLAGEVDHPPHPSAECGMWNAE